MKLDILGIFAHPDDAELACAGMILKHVAMGKKVGVVDLTEGQLGSRGTPETRLKEADEASKILGLAVRDNLGMEDGFFQNDEEHQKRIAVALRKYRPDIVITNAVRDRHPDHGKGSKLVADACFYSGLHKIETFFEGEAQEAWRPRAVYNAIQDHYIDPDFVVDVSEYAGKKFEAILAFKSQFFNPDSNEPETPISTMAFQENIRGRMRAHGRLIGVEYGEGFTVNRAVGVEDITLLA